MKVRQLNIEVIVLYEYGALRDSHVCHVKVANCIDASF